MHKLSIWASGSGSNAENIYNYFKNSKEISIDHILCNKKDAGVFERAKKLGVDAKYFSSAEFRNSTSVLDFLKEREINYIILAGFLLKVSEEIIFHYPARIINIHPALLPDYGGKGMYGLHVHEAVIVAGEKHSGITIHLVDEEYDHGTTIFQSICEIEKGETPKSLAEKVHQLEYKHYPEVIQNYILSFNS
ncbi:MAG: phosphoribosylglycinamide formyltransferase [Marinilabiliales bacterium]|nr:MAG: phosphoribosylglycinamide formyltransferase [Marinilabiliales bacterium]